MTIVEFLLARIAEDEGVARAAGSVERWGVEQPQGLNLHVRTEIGSMGWDFSGGSGVWGCDDPYDDCGDYQNMAFAEADHIARHDPARVLAECEAKRRIVASETSSRTMHPRVPWDEMRWEGDRLVLLGSGGWVIAEGAEADALVEQFSDAVTDTPTLRMLAAVYADHPDYDLAWRP